MIGALITAIYGVMTGVDGVGAMAAIIINIGEGNIAEVVCFSPDTTLELLDKSRKKIKDLEIGDYLVSGGKITGVLKLANKDFMYTPKNKPTFYVTGKHYVRNDKNEFVYVKDHPDFIKTDIVFPRVYNLMVDNHLIPIDKYIFWDYNDDILNCKK